MFEKLLFKTNYNKDPLSSQYIKDSMDKFELPTDAAFRVFPRRKLWGSSGDGPYNMQEGWQNGEYDLYEVGRIIDTEAYVQQALQKKHTLIFKEGWTITSDNTTNLKYIKKRLAEIEYVSNTYWSKLLKEITFNLLAFHNVFILKVRKKNASSGNTRKWKGKGAEINPVSGYIVLPAEAMQYKVDQYGTVIAYRLNMNSHWIEYEARDIVHITFNKRTGYLMAPSPLEAVKDDILALRKIEESVESLIYKVLFPIIHVKVGTENAPAKILADGVTEVALATRLLKQIDDYGGIATSERIEINAIGAESQALRVESYLKYFKQRVYSGLGMSSLDYGDLEGSGAAAGDYVTSALKTLIFAYQDEIADAISRCLFDELLLEKGTYEHSFEIDQENRVFFSFSEADIDNKILKENHTINKVNADLMGTDEARKELKMPSLKDDNIESIHTVRVQKTHEDRQHKQAKDLAKHEAELVPPSTTTSTTKKATNGASTTTKVTKTGTAKSQPTKKSGAGNAAKAATKPKNQYSKDWLINRMFLVLNNKTMENKISVLTKHIADHVMFNATQGVADPEAMNPFDVVGLKDECEKLVIELMNAIASVDAKEISNPLLLNRKKDLAVSKTIDKVSNYVNNMIYG